MFYPKKIDKDGNGLGRYAFATSKVVCVGRNYAEHAKELSNPIPTAPLLFIKSSNTLVDLNDPILLPKDKGSCHHELDISLVIGKPLTNANPEQVRGSIIGVGLALDLTLRELQSELKSKGQPWEKAKSFDGACPVSGFIEISTNFDFKDIAFNLVKHERMIQQGNSASMLFPVEQLVAEISQHFSLYPGDIILTGTPKGVGPLNQGDQLKFQLNGCSIASTSVR